MSKDEEQEEDEYDAIFRYNLKSSRRRSSVSSVSSTSMYNVFNKLKTLSTSPTTPRRTPSRPSSGSSQSRPLFTPSTLWFVDEQKEQPISTTPMWKIILDHNNNITEPMINLLEWPLDEEFPLLTLALEHKGITKQDNSTANLNHSELTLGIANLYLSFTKESNNSLKDLSNSIKNTLTLLNNKTKKKKKRRVVNMEIPKIAEDETQKNQRVIQTLQAMQEKHDNQKKKMQNAIVNGEEKTEKIVIQKTPKKIQTPLIDYSTESSTISNFSLTQLNISSNSAETIKDKNLTTSPELTTKSFSPQQRPPTQATSHSPEFALRLSLKTALWFGRSKIRSIHRYTQVRESIIRLALDKGIVTKISEQPLKESIPYHNQGNLQLYTDENLKKRLALKSEPAIIHIIAHWWKATTKTNKKPRISKKTYVSLAMTIYTNLMPMDCGKTLEDARKNAEEDWKEDSEGMNTMDFEQFFNAIFQLADIWTESTNMLEYLEFLTSLFEKVYLDPTLPKCMRRHINVAYVRHLLNKDEDERIEIVIPSPIPEKKKATQKKSPRRPPKLAPIQYRITNSKKKNSAIPLPKLEKSLTISESIDKPLSNLILEDKPVFDVPSVSKTPSLNDIETNEYIPTHFNVTVKHSNSDTKYKLYDKKTQDEDSVLDEKIKILINEIRKKENERQLRKALLSLFYKGDSFILESTIMNRVIQSIQSGRVSDLTPVAFELIGMLNAGEISLNSQIIMQKKEKFNLLQLLEIIMYSIESLKNLEPSQESELYILPSYNSINKTSGKRANSSTNLTTKPTSAKSKEDLFSQLFKETNVNSSNVPKQRERKVNFNNQTEPIYFSKTIESLFKAEDNLVLQSEIIRELEERELKFDTFQKFTSYPNIDNENKPMPRFSKNQLIESNPFFITASHDSSTTPNKKNRGKGSLRVNKMNKPETWELFDLEGEIKLKEEKIEKMPNAASFTINKEDHTLGNIVRMKLLEDKRVLFAGYRIPHPLEHHIEVKLQTIDQWEPREVLVDSVTSLIRDLNTLKSEFKKNVQDIVPNYRAYDDEDYTDNDDGVQEDYQTYHDDRNYYH
ncbi:hypothetical protein ABK040_006453 [Willaertia magna]